MSMNNLTWRSCIRAATTIFTLFLLIFYWSTLSNVATAIVSAASTLILGAVMAFVVNIPMSFYERKILTEKILPKKGVRRGISLLLAFGSVIAIVWLIIQLIIPELLNAGELLIAEIPPYIDSFIAYLEANEVDIEAILQTIDTSGILASLENMDWQSILSTVGSFFLGGISDIMTSVVTLLGSIVSVIVSLLLSTIFAIYILGGKEKLGSQLNSVLDTYVMEKIRKKIHYVVDVLNDCFHKFIVGQCTEAVILGLLCIGGMLVFRFPYATMIGTLIGFTALIPVVGAFIGGGIGAFLIFTVSPIQALFFIIFLLVLQQLEGNIIYPRVVGASIGLPGIWVLASITIGGGLGGMIGMLVAVPLTATVYRLIGADIKKRNEPALPKKKKTTKEAEATQENS